MKKILTALLLFTDLYGMMPRYFVDTKNPKEDQVEMMHSDFLQNISLAVASFDEYKAYTGEFEYIKNALFDKYARFFERGRRYLFAEVNAISRYPNAKERDAVQKFAKVLGLQDEDLQIKVIDAESYIQGIYLSEDRRNYFLDWLHNPNQAKDWMLFSEHLSKIHFPNKFYLAGGETLKINGGEGQNEAFRKKVLKIIVDSSKASDIYRGLMICFFAKMEAIPSVCSRYAYKGFSNSILEGNTSCHCREGISLSQEENGKLLYQTLVKSDQTVGPFPSGFSSFPLALPRTLFHECGHFLDFFSGAFEGYKSNKTVEEVVLKFFDFQTDKEAFKEHKSNLKKRMEKHPLSLSSAQTLMKKNFGSIDDFIKYREDNLDNPIVQTKIFISSALEAWQIFGVSLLTHEYSKVLYINRMSDFALYLKLLIPVRMSHLGLDLPIDEEEFKKTPFIRHKFPLEVYGALMDFYGTSLSAYLMQMRYPKGVSSLLQNEYRLVRNIPEQQQIRLQIYYESKNNHF